VKKFLFLILILVSKHASAQQTIFNVPSADITEKNRNFFQHESAVRMQDPGKFWGTTNYFARGLGSNVELDATMFNLNDPASKNVTLGVGPKAVLPLAKNSYQPKLILGGMLPFSLQGKGAGHWIYSAGSITIPQTNTRLTAGISNGTKQIFNRNVTCFIGGFEQKVTEDLSLIADWYSGNHDIGILAAGFGYTLPREFMLYAGYQIPNSKRVARNSVVIEVARFF